LRYYYDKNIIKKVLGQKFVYRWELLLTVNCMPLFLWLHELKMADRVTMGKISLFPFRYSNASSPNKLLSKAEWCRYCDHLRGFNLNHFKIFESMWEKLASSWSPLVA
jgi:hypothetical protein